MFSCDLSLKREHFRVQIRRQAINQFLSNKRGCQPCTDDIEPTEHEIEFISSIIKSLHRLNLDSQLKEIQLSLELLVKAFEESQKSTKAFSQLMSEEIEFLMRLSQLSLEIKLDCVCLLFQTLFNIAPIQIDIYDKFDNEQVAQFLVQNADSDDIRIVEYVCLCVAYLAHEKSRYRDLLTVGNLSFIINAIRKDKDEQISATILGLITTALEFCAEVPYDVSTRHLHPYLSKQYYGEGLSVKSQVTQAFISVIEKVEEQRQREFTEFFMESPVYKAIEQSAKQDFPQTLLPICLLLNCYSLTEQMDESVLNFFFRMLCKYQDTQNHSQSGVRIRTYWALSNCMANGENISKVVHHQLFKYVIRNLGNETPPILQEISYVLLNLAQAGSSQHLSKAIKENLLDACKQLLLQNIHQINVNIVKLLVLMLKKLKSETDLNNEVLIGFFEVRKMIEQQNIHEIVMGIKGLDDQLLREFDVFY